jgi:hypothetical protein
MPEFLIPQGLACPYRSKGDEVAFFAWLESIPGIVRFRGVGHHLVVTTGSKRISDAGLRELIALHARYNLPMAALSQFRTAKNRHLFGPRP